MRGNRTLRLLGRLTADLDAAMYDWEDGGEGSDARQRGSASGADGAAVRGTERLPVPA